MPDVPVRLPRAASEAPTPPLPGSRQDKPAAVLEGAYIMNPIKGREKLTRLEALDAISVLSAVLSVDEAHRVRQMKPTDGVVKNG